MGKHAFGKKRTRLIAALAALCAALAVGIGVGAAAPPSRAAQAKGSFPSPVGKVSKAGKDPAFVVHETQAQINSDPELSFCNHNTQYYFCQGFIRNNGFNSSAQVNNLAWAPWGQGNYTNWQGNDITASITLQGGVEMPIALPIGLWNGSEFVNPNSISPQDLKAYMLQGNYMGNISLVDNYGRWYSFLGGVGYNGTLDTAQNNFMTENSDYISHHILDNTFQGQDYSGIINLQPQSVQYSFQSLCNSSEMLNNPYFEQHSSMSDSQLQGIIQNLLLGKTGLYPMDQYYYGRGAASGSKVDQDLSSLKTEAENLSSQATVDEYKKAFEAYQKAAKQDGVTYSTPYTSPSYQKAREAYLSALGQDAKNDQPLLCLAVWNQNVGYKSLPSTEYMYVQGSNKSQFESSNILNALDGATSGSGDFSYAYWGAGPSYVGASSSSEQNTLSMDVTSVATSFLKSLLFSDSEKYSNEGIHLGAIFYPGQNTALYTYGGSGVQVNIEPAKTSSGQIKNNGIGQHFTFVSLGQSATQVNPESMNEGTSLSPSAPSSDGLYFEALSQTGEPLKSVKMELWPDPNSSVNQNWQFTGWTDTPIAPATNSANFASTPETEQKELWPDVGNTYWAGYYENQTFTANSLTSQPGWFDFSGIAPGVYEAKILSGTTEDGKPINYGSYYQAPTFQITADSQNDVSAGSDNGAAEDASSSDYGKYYNSPELMQAQTDPCGFVDPAKDLVTVGANNPSSSLISGAAAPAGSGQAASTSNPYTATVGKDNPFTYQTEAYMPFDLSGQKNSSGTLASSSPLTFTLSSLPSGEVIDAGSIEVNGKSLSSLGVTPASSSSGFSFTLSPSQISSIGSQGETIDVTFTAYLNPSFTSPGSPKYEFAYKAYSTANSGNSEEDLAPVSTNGPANNSVPSTLTTSTPSSSTGLWFKSLNADGSASSGSKFIVKNSDGKYLQEDKSSSGAFTGWSWTSTPSNALEFSQRNDDAVFSFGGLQDGTYTVAQVEWPTSVGKSGQENTGEQNWPGISPSQTTPGNPEWAGYPGHLGGKEGYNGSFQVTLGYSSPEAMATSADPAGLVNASKDSIYAFAPVKMAPLVSGALSIQDYQTETVGVPFTEGWEGYLPMAVTSPDTAAGQNGYASQLDVSFPENDSGLNNNGNSYGLKMSNPTTSNIEVAGVSLSTLVSNGAKVTTANGDYSISLHYEALQYLEANGKNAAGESLSSSSNRLILITFPAVMTTNFSAEGGKFQQWMAFGSKWWNQNAGSGWGVYSSPLYTNGPADNSLPTTLSPTENSSKTGIWFKSLWYNTSTPAPGSKYTVSETQGGKTVYLTPVESGGTFEGWSWQSSPYEFTEKDAASAVFSMGGLADGTYTLTQVSPATGATASTLTFTSTLSYSSPESLKAVKDSLNLLDSSKDTVWAIVVPSSLPLTGGKMVLLVSLSSVVLFGAGALFFILRKRRRA